MCIYNHPSILSGDWFFSFQGPHSPNAPRFVIEDGSYMCYFSSTPRLLHVQVEQAPPARESPQEKQHIWQKLDINWIVQKF